MKSLASALCLALLLAGCGSTPQALPAAPVAHTVTAQAAFNEKAYQVDASAKGFFREAANVGKRCYLTGPLSVVPENDDLYLRYILQVGGQSMHSRHIANPFNKSFFKKLGVEPHQSSRERVTAFFDVVGYDKEYQTINVKLRAIKRADGKVIKI